MVGDSASMMVYGYSTTIPVSMDEMLLVVRAVSRGSKNALVVADLPFLSYQSSIEETIKNLDGVFAFVLYDKNEDKLVIGRDHLGIRGLFIGTKGENEIKPKII